MDNMSALDAPQEKPSYVIEAEKEEKEAWSEFMEASRWDFDMGNLYSDRSLTAYRKWLVAVNAKVEAYRKWDCENKEQTMEYTDEYVRIFDAEWSNPRITILYDGGTVQTIDDVFDVQIEDVGAAKLLMIVSEVKTFYVNLDKVQHYSIENGE